MSSCGSAAPRHASSAPRASCVCGVAPTICKSQCFSHLYAAGARSPCGGLQHRLPNLTASHLSEPAASETARQLAADVPSSRTTRRTAGGRASGHHGWHSNCGLASGEARRRVPRTHREHPRSTSAKRVVPAGGLSWHTRCPVRRAVVGATCTADVASHQLLLPPTHSTRRLMPRDATEMRRRRQGDHQQQHDKVSRLQHGVRKV